MLVKECAMLHVGTSHTQTGCLDVCEFEKEGRKRKRRGTKKRREEVKRGKGIGRES